MPVKSSEKVGITGTRKWIYFCLSALLTPDNDERRWDVKPYSALDSVHLRHVFESRRHALKESELRLTGIDYIVNKKQLSMPFYFI